MKKILIIIFICTSLYNCKNTSEKQIPLDITSNTPIKTAKDTLINLTEDLFFHFTQGTSSKDGTILYQNRYIITIKGDTLTKLTTNYSEVFIKLSPNKDYLITDDIIRGYVQTSETDSIFNENYVCALINLNNGKTVTTYQSACGGAWNEKNQWIYGDEIIFDASQN